MGTDLEYPWWAYYPKIEKLEVVYWRGMEYTSWWNNFAKDLVEYAWKNLPHKYLDYYSYNTNPNPSNPDQKLFFNRIYELKRLKRLKYPLIVVNHSQYIEPIDSSVKLEQALDWIDAEWSRYYGKPPTTRRPGQYQPLYRVTPDASLVLPKVA